MSRLIFIAAALFIVASTPLSAQYPDVETNPPKGELAVYAIGGVGNEWIHVRLDANGVIYNDVGEYNVNADPNHPNGSRYGTDHLYGTDCDLYAPGNEPDFPTWTSWESVYRDDDSADDDECSGMFGWGEYKLSFTYLGHTEELFINTIDGNWMNASYGNANKIVIAVIVVNQGGVYSFTFKQYDWGSQSWNMVNNGSAINIWDQLGDARNRSTIDVLNDQQFTWPALLLAPSVVDDITLNHNILVEGIVTIPDSKSLTFTDDGGLPTYVTCGSAAQFFAIGRLRSKTNLTTQDYYCVHFVPESFPTNNRSSWPGIKVSAGSQEYETVDLSRAYLSYADYAVTAVLPIDNGYGGVTLDNCKIENCWKGLLLDNVRGDVRNTEIVGCGNGIELRNKVYNDDGPTTIQECYIHHSTPAGGQQNYGAGIVITSPDNAHDQSKTEAEQVLISQCRINYNWYDGVVSLYHDWAVYNSEVMHNGYRWGKLRSEIPRHDMANGLSGWYSNLVVHGNSIMYNKATGLLSYSGLVIGHTPADDDGKNCFDGNGYQIRADQKSEVYLGGPFTDPSTGGTKILGGNNSFLWPREVTPAALPSHFRVESEAIIYAYRNYFLPYAFGCWEEYGGGWVDVADLITDPQLAICAPPQWGGSGEVQTYERDSENASKAAYGMVKHIAYDSTWMYTSAAFSETLNDYEVRVVSKAAGYCYYYGGIQAALDTLDMYAYRIPVLESGKCFASLQELISVHLRKKNQAECRRAADTLRLRSVELTGRYDSVFHVLTMAELEARINTDTLTAIGLLDSLLTNHPDSWVIRHRLYHLTSDTSYVASDTSMMKAAGPDAYKPPAAEVSLDIFPNPVNNGSIITVSGTKSEHIEVSLFDVLGRKIKVVYSGRIPENGLYLKISNVGITSGIYYVGVLTASGSTVSKNLIAN
jgi:hypothetical protein